MTEPCRLTAVDAAAQIAAGKLTSEALVRSCLDRIAAREPVVQAWAYLDPDHAIAQAKLRDAETVHETRLLFEDAERALVA